MRLVYVVSAFSLIAACASGPKTAVEGGAPRTAAPVRRDRNVLLRSELSESQAFELTALQAIRQFRPNFFSGASSPSMAGPARMLVYINDVRQGGIDVLAQLRMTEVERIEYLSASEATMKFGTGQTGGAIIVTRRQ